MWTTLFRAANPSGWTKLVSELRQHSGELWNNIVKTYGHDVQRLEKDPKTGKEVWKDDDDKIADEAFAHAVGKEGESLIAAHYDSNKGSMGIINYIKQKFESLLTYIKNYFNLSPYARALKQLVLKDMLSDNPLENFGEVAEALDPNKKAEGHSTVKPFVLNLGDFLNSGHFVRVYRTKFKFDLTKGTVEIPGTYSDKDLRKMGYKGTIRREHRALRESYMHPIMGLADSVFGGHMLYIIIGIVVR